MEKYKKRVCSNCKFNNVFNQCETLKKELDKLPEPKDTMERLTQGYEIKDNFTCEKFKSRYIEYPIEVSEIVSKTDYGWYGKEDIGKPARVRPCGEEYENKTYLGIYLGELPQSHAISHHPETKELTIAFRNNPAILVPELKKIIFGSESFWSIVEDPEDFKDISDELINNQWYVKALKDMSENEKD